MGLRPKVDIQVNSALGLVSGSSQAVCAIIGTSQWGPINEVQNITNFNDGRNIFKDDNSGTDLTLIKGLDLLYSNGAGSVKAIRVEDGTADYAELNLLNSSSPAILISGKYKGTYGNNIMVTVTANPETAANRDVEITDGVSLENYNNGGLGYASNTLIVSAINANSVLVTATKITDDLVDAATQTNLSGGLDGSSSLTQANFTDILDDKLYSEDYNILVIPGQSADSFHTAVVGKLNSRAANDDKFSVYFSGVTKDESLTTIAARTTSGSRIALLSPSVKYTNRISNSEQILDGSYLACAYAGVSSIGYPELSATHKTLSVGGLSVNSTSGKEYYNNSEAETLLQNRVVPVTKIAGSIQSVRAVTRNTSTTDVFYEQNIVNIVDYTKQKILEVLNPFIGNPNLQRVRTVMAKNVDGVLEQEKLDEIIVDFIPTAVTEASTDTVNVSITIKPTFLVNFINVTLTLDNVSN